MHIETDHHTDGDTAETLPDPISASSQVTRSPSVPVSRAASQTVAYPRSRRGSTDYDLLLGRLLQQSGHYSAGLFIGFAGCHRRSGVSTIAANIAIRAADLQNGSVLLVEANTDYPRQRRHFGIVEGPGLVEVLGGSVALDEAIVPTRVQGLSLLGSRTRNRMAPLAVMEGAVDGFIKEVRNSFSVVVFDFPSDESLSNWRPLFAKP
jgi:Mrp family chromosome partitioning ATPase